MALGAYGPDGSLRVTIAGTDPVPVGSTDPSQQAQALSTKYAGNAAGREYSVYTPSPTGVVLSTAPVNLNRLSVEVQNQSAVDLTIFIDDGLGTTNTVTKIVVSAASVVGSQGGGWQSYTFKGRVRVFGAAGSIHSLHED